MSTHAGNSRLKPALIMGFGAILAVLSVVAGTALYHTQVAEEQLTEVATEVRETRMVFDIRDAVNQQGLALIRSVNASNATERESAFRDFALYTAQFAAAKASFQANTLVGAEMAVWQTAKQTFDRGAQVQSDILSLIRAGEVNAADRMLQNEIANYEQSVRILLGQLVSGQTDQIESTLLIAAADTKFVRIMLTGLAGFLGILVTVFAFRSISRSESHLITEREAAESANQQKSLFLANMSHEIRTPLTAIIGFGECLLTEVNDNAQRKEMTHAIVRNSKHLLKLINGVLDLSKIESNKLQLETIDVNPFHVLTELDSIVGHVAREKGLEFELRYSFPLPTRIHTDPTRMKQILLNVSSNAVKFTAAGKVAITTRFDSTQESLFFTVEDTGIGMSQEQATRIFKAFTQADASTTRKYGGTGLGLSISKMLAQLLGGDLVCESEPDKGSRFTFILKTGALDASCMVSDLESVAPTANEAMSPTTAMRFKGRVLLAEDSPDIQKLVSLYLTRCGAEVTVVANGQLAVEIALVESFDLILMDMQMPVMDGIEATTLLRNTGYGLPIVALSANAMKDERNRFMAAGINAFLAKPVELKPFYETLTQYLKTEAHSLDSMANPIGAALSFEQDPEFQRLSQEFQASLPATFEKIIRAIELQDTELVRLTAHTLKGLGGNFGHPRITELAKEVETFAKNGALESAQAATAKLTEYYDSTKKTA